MLSKSHLSVSARRKCTGGYCEDRMQKAGLQKRNQLNTVGLDHQIDQGRFYSDSLYEQSLMKILSKERKPTVYSAHRIPAIIPTSRHLHC